MILEQICILNNAIDGKDIYSIPTFAGLKMSETSLSKNKDALIEKGILETHSSFTSEGFLAAMNILDFKNAKKYITFVDFVLGIVDDDKAVMLRFVNKEYSFSLVNIENSVKQLTDVYKFLSLDCESEEHGMPMRHGELVKYFKHDLSINNSFGLMTEQGKKITKEIFFSHNEKIYIYDCIEKLLYQKSNNNVEKILIERMTAPQ